MIIGINGKIGSGKDTIGKIIQYLMANPEIKEITTLEELLDSDDLNGRDFNWKIKKFADRLKDMVCLLISCTKEQLEDHDFKNTELGEEWWKWKITSQFDTTYYASEQEALESHGGYYKPELIKPTPRLLLQLLGTDCGRNIIHPNIWVNALMSEYKDIRWISKAKWDMEKGLPYNKNNDKPIYPNWIITDMRFPNEMEAVKQRGGITIRVSRTGIHTPKIEDLHPSETALDNSEFDYHIDNSGTIEELVEKVREILINEKLL